MIELTERRNVLLTFLRVEWAIKFKFYLFTLCEFEGFRTSEGTFIFIIFDASHALETNRLLTSSIADVWFFCDVVADGALVFFCF